MPLSEIQLIMINTAVDELAEGGILSETLYAGTIVEPIIESHPRVLVPIFNIAKEGVPRIGAQKTKLSLYLQMLVHDELEARANGFPELSEPRLRGVAYSILEDNNLAPFEGIRHLLTKEAREQIAEIGFL